MRLPFLSIVIPMFYDTLSHYLVGDYITHQSDGMHIEAYCTCGEKFEGIGQDEGAAMSTLWAIFLQNLGFSP
jgi:hypothetical protein